MFDADIISARSSVFHIGHNCVCRLTPKYSGIPCYDQLVNMATSLLWSLYSAPDKGSVCYFLMKNLFIKFGHPAARYLYDPLVTDSTSTSYATN